MQKVVIVNLNGIAYHLEESAHAALSAYLARAEAQLRDNPDRLEIVGDLEQAIADKFARYLGPGKNVVTAGDMTTILDEMGPVHDDTGTTATSGEAPGDRTGASSGSAAAGGSAASDPSGAGATKRLYRMLDTGFIGGVCSGIATFSDTDVTLVRIGATLLGLLELALLHTPFTAMAYIAAMFIIPAADTSEERAAARGIPFNAQQLIDEAKRNFERLGDHDWKESRQEWKRHRRWQRRYERRIKHSYAWPPQPAPGPYGSQVVAGFMTPVFTIISVGAFWFMLFAALSLSQTRGVYHWTMPDGIPLWMGLLVLFFAYQAIVAPLRFWRHASYYRLGGPDHARYQALDGIMSMILSIAIVWTAYHYSPELREWLRHLPDAWHNIAASFRS